MSRAERRQYRRMMKGQDPFAVPPRGVGRPPRRTRSRQPHDWSFNRGFWAKSLVLAAVLGLAGLSIAWGSGPQIAVTVGAAAVAATLALLVALRLVMQRASTR